MSDRGSVDFEALTHVEESANGRGYRGGYEHGAAHGAADGGSLGAQHGFSVWTELGYYEGLARTWIHVLQGGAAGGAATGAGAGPTSRVQAKQAVQVTKFLELIDQFPMENHSVSEPQPEGLHGDELEPELESAADAEPAPAPETPESPSGSRGLAGQQGEKPREKEEEEIDKEKGNGMEADAATDEAGGHDDEDDISQLLARIRAKYRQLARGLGLGAPVYSFAPADAFSVAASTSATTGATTAQPEQLEPAPAAPAQTAAGGVDPAQLRY